MSRIKSSIKKVKCPRCSKEAWTSVKSLTGTELLKRKFEGICSDCATPEEQNEMLMVQAMSITSNASSKRWW